MIKISGLIFEYPGHRALDDISLTVAPGSVTALVGPNGAGKTTLLRCIAGLEPPLAGAISVAGLNVVEQPRQVHRTLGYLSDFFGLYQTLTVAQCLAYAAASQGLPEKAIPGAITTTAARLGLTGRLTQPAGSLSRGLRQRVAIGQAIIHSPKVLLLDEPASGLDPEARAGLAQLLRELQAEGMTIVVSSHILAELDEYSTHMLALRAGRIFENRPLGPTIQSGTSRRLRLELAGSDRRLAEWLGQRQMLTTQLVGEGFAELDFAGNLTAQAELLRDLIAAGFPVATLAEQRENLQQSYLRSLALETEGESHV
ncbi:MAG: ABC transporter ATP-binding protein [Desulfobulbaceae bacterium]|nr:ABC transporter ATP-binding protein [Desulfobulbaceae bacterium]